jgi:predicted alpha/beta-fold hydrolase
VDGLASFAFVGYSRGQLTLKLAGDFGAHPPKSSVRCAPSRRQWIWQDAWKRWSGRKTRSTSVISSESQEADAAEDSRSGQVLAQALAGIRTIRQFDEAYTAPFHEFSGASDYYHRVVPCA